jgi:hypothetical protein
VSAERRAERRRTLLTGGAGFLMLLCCLAGPALLGAVGGTAIGGALGIATAVSITLAVAALLHWRNRKKGHVC